MKILPVFIGILAFTLISCGSSKSKVSQAQIDALDEMVQQRHFRIESDWAYPQVTMALQQVFNAGLQPSGSSASAVNLIGNPNFLTITGDSISSFLPYYGERQMHVDYAGGDSAIQLKGIMEDYKVEKTKDNNYEITFKAKSKSEQFDVYIKLSPNLISNIVCNSGSRFPIRYSGKVEPLRD